MADEIMQRHGTQTLVTFVFRPDRRRLVARAEDAGGQRPDD